VLDDIDHLLAGAMAGEAAPDESVLKAMIASLDGVSDPGPLPTTHTPETEQWLEQLVYQVKQMARTAMQIRQGVVSLA